MSATKVPFCPKPASVHVVTQILISAKKQRKTCDLLDENIVWRAQKLEHGLLYMLIIYHMKKQCKKTVWFYSGDAGGHLVKVFNNNRLTSQEFNYMAYAVFLVFN